jgi:hypothetical protein
LISVGKSGVRVQFTDELMKDSEWDIVGMLLSEAGRAMARHKEQKAFLEWLKHGWVVFDNNLKDAGGNTVAEAHTTGVGETGTPNETMSIEDFLDLIIAVYNNEYTATDLVMHPLSWVAFAKNGLTGVYSAVNERDAKIEAPNSSFKLGPESLQGRLPFSFNVNLSPFAPINKTAKTFDMFVVDRNNVGVMIVKDDLTTEEFRDPARDIRNVKVIERYGFSTYNEGRAVCMAKNISMAKSYPAPLRVKQL